MKEIRGSPVSLGMALPINGMLIQGGARGQKVQVCWGIMILIAVIADLEDWIERDGTV